MEKITHRMEKTMKRIAKFNKVSKEQFLDDWRNVFGMEEKEEEILSAYSSIMLPRRATAGSAGYDFFLPCPVCLDPGESVNIPTGIRVELCEGWVLLLYPRSGLGFKYRLQLNNTVGVVDSDYFYSDNEGHIFIKIFNDSREGKRIELHAQMAFAQGIFMEYGIAADDDAIETRNGGFGSTG